MVSQEENLVILNEFLEKADKRLLVIALTPQSQIYPSTSFPASSKTKASWQRLCMPIVIILQLTSGCVFREVEGRSGEKGYIPITDRVWRCVTPPS